MATLMDLLRIVVYPRRRCRAILQQRTITSSLGIVLIFGAVVSLLFLRSHLAQDYPPPPEDLETWIEAWGEFTMLPFLKISADRYRLAQAVFMLPLVLAAWMLMAGSARVLSVLFGGRTTYVQYLNLFGHTFFAFWILAVLLDTLYSALLGDHVLRALRGEYGPLARALVVNYPVAVWTGLLGLGGVYNGIATHESEGFSLLKVAAIAAVTAFWPIALSTLLLR